MKFFLIVFAIFLTIFGVFFAHYNGEPLLNLSLMYTGISFQISFEAIMIAGIALGILIGLMFMFAGYLTVALENKKLRKRLEKENLFMENSDSRVKVLENKIMTLEKALEKALDEKKDE